MCASKDIFAFLKGSAVLDHNVQAFRLQFLQQPPQLAFVTVAVNEFFRCFDFLEEGYVLEYGAPACALHPLNACEPREFEQDIQMTDSPGSVGMVDGALHHLGLHFQGRHEVLVESLSGKEAGKIGLEINSGFLRPDPHPEEVVTDPLLTEDWALSLSSLT